MRFLSKKQCVITAVLAVCAILSMAGVSAAQEAKPSGWYVGASVGLNKTSGIEQAGWNRDNVCYPGDDCSRLEGGRPGGYRWYYDLDADEGAALEISVGRTLGAFRLELALAQRKNDLDQKFTGITYLDGSSRTPAASSDYQQITSGSDVDDLTTRTLSLNAYYDFTLPESRFTPYLGGGVGVSFVEVGGVYYEGRYSCKPSAPDCDRPEQYDGLQDEDLTDTVLSAHLHAGLDYRVSERTLLGVKLTYSMVGDMKDVKGEYIEHAVPGLPNFTTISGMNHWSVMFGVKYFFGE